MRFCGILYVFDMWRAPNMNLSKGPGSGIVCAKARGGCCRSNRHSMTFVFLQRVGSFLCARWMHLYVFLKYFICF